MFNVLSVVIEQENALGFYCYPDVFLCIGGDLYNGLGDAQAVPDFCR